MLKKARLSSRLRFRSARASIQFALRDRRFELGNLGRLWRLAVEGEHIALARDCDGVAILDLARQNHLGERVLHAALDHPLQGACAIGGIPAPGREPVACRRVQRQRDLAFLQELLQPRELDLDDPAHLALLQAMEQDDLVDAVQELRPKCARTIPITWSRTAVVSSPSGWFTRNSEPRFEVTMISVLRKSTVR